MNLGFVAGNMLNATKDYGKRLNLTFPRCDGKPYKSGRFGRYG